MAGGGRRPKGVIAFDERADERHALLGQFVTRHGHVLREGRELVAAPVRFAKRPCDLPLALGPAMHDRFVPRLQRGICRVRLYIGYANSNCA